MAVFVTLNLVRLLIENLEHPCLFFPVHKDVLLDPLLLMDLGHMTDHILLAVVGVSTGHAFVRLHPWVQVELQVLDERNPAVEHLVALVAFEVELVVDLHVILEPVLVRKVFPAQVAENGLDLEVNWTNKKSF